MKTTNTSTQIVFGETNYNALQPGKQEMPDDGKINSEDICYDNKFELSPPFKV